MLYSVAFNFQENNSLGEVAVSELDKSSCEGLYNPAFSLSEENLNSDEKKLIGKDKVKK